MDQRSLHAGAPRSATLRAMRPDVLSDMVVVKTEDTQRRRPVPDDYPESMACSVSTLSSHPASPAMSDRSPLFDPAVYMGDHDQIPDSVDIMPHSRQTSLDSQSHDLTNRTFDAKVPLSKLSLGRPHSLNLPLRTRKDYPTEEKTDRSSRRATTYSDRASSVNPGRFNVRAFE